MYQYYSGKYIIPVNQISCWSVRVRPHALLLPQLKAGDRLGIVVFHTKVKQLLPLTEMTPCGKHRVWGCPGVGEIHTLKIPIPK